MDIDRFKNKLRTVGVHVDKVSGGDAQNLKPRHLFINDEFIYWTEDGKTERDPIRSVLKDDVTIVTEGYITYSEYITIETSNPRRPKVIVYVKDKQSFGFLMEVFAEIMEANRLNTGSIKM
jgi:hypothetical protein